MACRNPATTSLGAYGLILVLVIVYHLSVLIRICLDNCRLCRGLRMAYVNTGILGGVLAGVAITVVV